MQLNKDFQQEPFLQQVADDLLRKYGNDLSRVTVVFPGRRARLFFNEYLCQASESPVWAPAYVSLDELFKQASGLQSADPLKLLTELYYTYTSVFQQNNPATAIESFDEFYFFGEILLSDFNDVDKNRVNEIALFSNLEELDKLKDDFEHLDPEQWKIVQRFFKDISTNRTQLKEAFFSIWSILGKVYTEFKNKLLAEGIAYDGMLFRSVVDDLEANGVEKLSQEKYAFVGFNVLTECEKALFKILQYNDKALFYWDYDEYYMQASQEAGRFMRDNLKRFPCVLEKQDTDTFLSSKASVTIVESSSESAQAGYISHWLNEVKYKEVDAVPDTAIVLCNEQNLQAVMHALPVGTKLGDSVSANITMGFPLTQTPVFSLIVALVELQLKGLTDGGSRFRYNFVLPVLRHPYVQLIAPNAAAVQTALIKNNNFFPSEEELQNPLIFTSTKDALGLSAYLVDVIKMVALKYGEQVENDDNFRQLYTESLFRAFQTVNRLHDLLATGELQIEKGTFVSLLKRLLSGTSVPFHGEPARALQVMGLLETRNMDFRNVLMMSVNEGVLPKADSDSSFIPHFIRKFFGMTTIEHQDSLYAYYFYRLLQRAENVVLIYNAANAQTGKMEKSRFLLQLLTESGLDIKRVNLKADMHPHTTTELRVVKTKDLIEKLQNQYDLQRNPSTKGLSPSALNNYMDCSLRFYLQYVEGIRPPQELTDELDNSVLGKVFHKAMELIYLEMGRVKKDDGKPFPAFVVNADMIDAFLKIPVRMEKAIEEAFNEDFFGKRKVPRARYNGEQLVYFGVVKQFVRRLLALDKTYAPFTVRGLEAKESRIIPVDDMQLKVGGVVDRLDEKDGVLRIVDYKTGGKAKTVNDMDKLFVRQKDRANYVFQTFLYASILMEKVQSPVAPALIYIQEAGAEDYNPIITFNQEAVNDFRTLNEEFETRLTEMLQSLFDKEIPFEQTAILENCLYCDFKGMCGR